jgi:endoglucanase
MNIRKLLPVITLLMSVSFIGCNPSQKANNSLKINDVNYFETRGLNILVFNNWYDVNMFSDSKLSGIEIIHHGVRTATNGDVRLNPTPEQWDPIPQLVKRTIDKQNNTIEAVLSYPEHNFTYTITARAQANGLDISVKLDKALPEALVGKAGLNLEFLPAAYFEKTYMIDNRTGLFPLYPGGPMTIDKSGVTEPKPIAEGKNLVLAPEDPARRITITAKTGELLLFDGRNKAQNGWFVVRSPIAANKTGTVVEWFLTGNTITNWTRTPVIAHSQVGYHPNQKKTAVIELDKNDKPLESARVLKVTGDGRFIESYNSKIQKWGPFLRYNYFRFDFTTVKEPGLYILEYGDVRTKPFRIADDIYEKAWQPTLDIYLPEQMDHMYVKEAYRVWHGKAHLDDARQAPVNHKHFDLYVQGPTTDSPYQPGEHITGLNIGGWYDAGDFDIQTGTHNHAVATLVQIWETFRPTRDETLIDENIKRAYLHHPDGIPDIIQQIEHGTLALIAQQRSIGHACRGIVDPVLSQYTHLGDGSTQTDNLIYNPGMEPNESNCLESGVPDDRWIFTTKSTPLNYGSAAALAAASRALRGYNDALADECVATAKKIWDEEHSHEPNVPHAFDSFGRMQGEELNAAIELLISTQDDKYAKRINEMMPTIERQFNRFAAMAVRAKPYMDAAYSKKLEPLVAKFKADTDKFNEQNPYGVPVSTGGWAGSGWVTYFGINSYLLHKAYPDIIPSEYALRAMDYLYGCHPDSDISFVSAVGTHSKKIAYGNNRADFSFIAGGLVPGILVIKPDFPENKEDWPFLWAENEYTVGGATSYIYLVLAANDLLKEM